MKTLIQKRLLYFGILAALFLEVSSFTAFFLEESSLILALFLMVIYAALTYRDFRIGIYLLFVELAIGGHGYFISLQIFDYAIALRHVWFIVLLSIFLIKQYPFLIEKIKTSEVVHRLMFVGLIGMLALLIAYVNGFPINNIFADGNAYIFYLLILPMLYIAPQISKEDLLNVIFGGLVILSIKTIITLAIFSNSLLLSQQWYFWVRDLRFGEVTYIDFSFFRVFFQSQVLLLPAMAMIASYIAHRKQSIEKEERFILLILLSLFLASIILSLSRSFWLAAFIGALVFVIFLSLYRKEVFYNLRAVIGYFLVASFIGIFLLSLAQSFSFNTSLLFYRLGDIQEEPAAASRWALLPIMIDAIKDKPVFGSGFGKEITYITSDPRIIEASDGTGKYTTFSLEWGYFDIWLKMGLIGLLALLYLFWYFLALQLKNMRQNRGNWYAFGASISIIMLLVLHFFTPYLNHPIGVGYLVLGLL